MLESEWIDHGAYLESRFSQRTPGWFKHRAGRVSSTLSAGLSGVSEYVSLDQAYNRYIGVSEEFDDFTKDVIKHGTILEAPAFEFYKDLISEASGAVVSECRDSGFCLSKSEPLFGASPDGLITLTKVLPDGQELVDKGVLEIKCPKYGLYESLQEFLSGGHPNADPESVTYDKYYHSHIKIDHYVQMQQHMFVTGRGWCDYVVYVASLDTPDDPRDFVVCRVWYNPVFFQEIRDKVRANLKL